jgi:3-methyladenine DNA glycosylase/8-oxoguanine DNA glycosylase
MNQYVYPISVPFNLEAIVKTHGWFQLAPFYWSESEKTLRWAVRISGKTRCVAMGQIEKKTVKLSSVELNEQVWQKLIAKFRHVFNLDFNLAPFYKQCASDPLLRPLKRLGMGRIMRSESVYEDVFKSICGTNVLWKQAVKMINTISELGEKTTPAGYRAFPTAQAVLNAGEKYLVEKGRVGYRSRYLIALCERVVKGDQKAKSVENGEIQGPELCDFFQSYMGIGRITARYLAALYGYFGELAVDSAVIAYMAKTHFNGRRPTEKEVQQHYERFEEWRYLAYWMEFIRNRGWVPQVD